MTSLKGFSQENRQINGRVKSLNNDISNVLIINLNSKKSTITDSLGLFTIEAKLKDSIRFAAVQYLTKEIIITDSIFSQKFIFINMVDNVINLKEVIVTPYNLTGKLDLDVSRLDIKPIVTSSTLGLPNADIEVMTQSERLLLEADRGKFVSLEPMKEFGIVNEIISYAKIPIKINTHKIMNRISGRTKSLKDNIVHDENVELGKEIIIRFSKKTISESFDIPETNIDGFLTYCMLQKDFSELSRVWNTDEIWNFLKIKSMEFKETTFTNE